MTQLTINGTAFRVEIEGDPRKPVLVLSNSLGTTLALWEGQMPALLQHFRVVRYDSRGHGGSADAKGPFSIRQLGQDVLAILDALEIETAHFVGISMGGAVGQWLLVNAPHRIERAVLANTAARLGTSDSWNARIRSVLAEGMEATATAAIERWFSAEFSQRNPETISALHEMLRRTPAQGYASSCAAIRDMDFRQSMHGVRHPVLVIAGADDPVTSEDDIATLVSALANGKLVTLDCRHLSNVEAAAAFNKAVLTFLSGKVAPRAATIGSPRPSRAPTRAPRRASRQPRAVRGPLKKTSAVKPAPPGRTSKASHPSATSSASTPAKPARKTPTRRAAKAPSVAKTGGGRRKRGPGAASTQTATRKAVKAVTAAPTRWHANNVAGASAPRKRAKAAPAKAHAKAGTSGRPSAAKIAPARRATPAASARASKAKSPARTSIKTVVAKPTTRKPAAKNTGRKLPSPRRKPPSGRRKGRGKS